MNMIIPSSTDLHYCTTSYQPKFDSFGNIDIADLLVSFQKIAGDHVEHLGMGAEFSEANGFYYILCRIKGYFLAKLKPEETYTFVTYPTMAGALQLYRYAYLVDSDGNPVFYLLSLWVLMNRETRRLQSAKAFQNKLREMLPDIDDVEPLTDERLYEMDFANQEFHYDSTYVVRSSDIDSNQHMNNTVYMKIAQEKCILSPISVFEIDFEKECYLHDAITVETSLNAISYSVMGKKSDGMLSFMARFFTSDNI